MNEENKKEESLNQNNILNDKQSISQDFKRNIAYKLRIGTIISGNPILEDERLRFIEIQGKKIIRVNLIANIIDKFVQEGEKKYASITLDDVTGQIRVKTFGEDIEKFSNLNQGDTILIIGLLRYWNNEIYLIPEIIKNKDPAFLMVRKLEIESKEPNKIDSTNLSRLKEKIIEMIKNSEKEGGIETEKIILELKEDVDMINKEIKNLINENIIYEPRPGKLRYLGTI